MSSEQDAGNVSSDAESFDSDRLMIASPRSSEVNQESGSEPEGSIDLTVGDWEPPLADDLITAGATSKSEEASATVEDEAASPNPESEAPRAPTGLIINPDAGLIQPSGIKQLKTLSGLTNDHDSDSAVEVKDMEPPLSDEPTTAGATPESKSGSATPPSKPPRASSSSTMTPDAGLIQSTRLRRRNTSVEQSSDQESVGGSPNQSRRTPPAKAYKPKARKRTSKSEINRESSSEHEVSIDSTVDVMEFSLSDDVTGYGATPQSQADSATSESEAETETAGAITESGAPRPSSISMMNPDEGIIQSTGLRRRKTSSEKSSDQDSVVGSPKSSPGKPPAKAQKPNATQGKPGSQVDQEPSSEPEDIFDWLVDAYELSLSDDVSGASANSESETAGATPESGAPRGFPSSKMNPDQGSMQPSRLSRRETSLEQSSDQDCVVVGSPQSSHRKPPAKARKPKAKKRKPLIKVKFNRKSFSQPKVSIDSTVDAMDVSLSDDIAGADAIPESEATTATSEVETAGTTPESGLPRAPSSSMMNPDEGIIQPSRLRRRKTSSEQSSDEDSVVGGYSASPSGKPPAKARKAESKVTRESSSKPKVSIDLTVDAMELSLSDDITDVAESEAASVTSESEAETARAPRASPSSMMNPDVGVIQSSRLRRRKTSSEKSSDQDSVVSSPKSLSGNEMPPGWPKAQTPKSKTRKPKPVFNFYGEKEYMVEKILGKKMVDGELCYRVKWVGWHGQHNTWEPLENLENAMFQVAAYEESLIKAAKSVPTPKINDQGDPSFYANEMGPIYRHVWDPSEQPLGIISFAWHKNTLLHLVKIAPADLDEEVPTQTPEQLLEDINDSNVVMVRASTMGHTFPQLTIKYYESNINFLEEAKSPEEEAADAARAVILQKGLKDESCNLEKLFGDMLPEGLPVLGKADDPISPGSGGVKTLFGSKKRLANEYEPDPTVDYFGLPMDLDCRSSSNSSDEEGEIFVPQPVKKLKKQVGEGKKQVGRSAKKVGKTGLKPKENVKDKDPNEMVALSDSDD